MLKLFARLFGTKSERDLKALWPYVAKINAEVEQLRPLSHDALRSKVPALQKHIQDTLKPFIDQRQALEKQAADNLQGIERLDQATAKLEKQYHEQLEAILIDLLPQAFAIVKETARRFKENPEITVTATPYDRTLADSTSYVTLQDDHAIWKNTWEAGGSPIVWDMVHYDVQLIGGIILHQGKIAEMATGEGKTLVATLPAFLNALAGRGVHIVTVNDYLAKRDAAWMAPLFQFHGLSVDCIDKHPSHSEARKKAYQAHITYGTNNEFGFDYLRDNMATTPEEVVQRPPHFAMVDEVDSVLIDDARTPLIISGPVEHSDEQDYLHLKPRIQQLYNAQKTLVGQLLQEAKKHIAEGNTDEGGLALFRAYRGLPKYKPLIKYLSEVGTKKILHKTENYYLQDNSRMMPEADEPLLFVIEEKNNSIELTEKGLEYITQQEEDTQFFVLPDIGAEVARIEHNHTLSEADKLTQKGALIKDYSIKSQRLHVIQQLLKAYTLFEIDVDYIVADRRVKIVDEQTGRVLEGRRYSEGLHQALEAKESVKIEKASQTYATITLQNYFRMYHKLAGMTGTAITEASEFWEIYHLDVVVTPPNKPIIRDDKDDKVYKTAREKFQAIIEEIITLTQQNRPVLVGTTSVEISELVSRLLTMRKIKHQVLNAKQHQREAEIVAEAGKPSTVTIATNMAGRGTDIKLTPEAKAAGGLAIIGTERHESRRVDRQLRGRAGRQGDVGSSQFFVSLEDNLMRLFGSDRIARLMDRMGLQEGEVIQHSMITRSIERAQKKVEQSNFSIRKRLLEYDNVMNSQREVIYKKRKNALFGKRLDWDLKAMLHETVEGLQADYPDSDQRKALQAVLQQIFGQNANLNPDESTEALYQQVLKAHLDRKTELQQETAPLVKALTQLQTTTPTTLSVPYASTNTHLQVSVHLQACIDTAGKALVQSLEKITLLHYIDQHWKDHLRAMDDLKQSVQNAVYERQDPLVIYKLEGYNLFQQLLRTINHTTLSFLHQAELQANRPEEVTIEAFQDTPAIPEVHPALSESKQIIESLLATQNPTPERPQAQPRKSQKIAQRNQRVTVRYPDGTIKENVKFKNVEDDLANDRCELL